MKQLNIATTAFAVVTLDGLDINDVIKQAADLAHEVLEELSIYRQRNGLDSDTFGNLHLYQKRYTLEGIGFKLEVLWGENWYSTYFGVILTGMNYKCSLYDDTHVMDAKDYFKKLLHQMIEVYCSKIKESFIRGGIIKYERTDLSILVR